MKPITDKKILDDIIKRMEQGVLPWHKPWSDSTEVVVIGSMKYSTTMWPSNLRAPKAPFGVFNGGMLLARAVTQKYRSNLWITDSVVKDLKADLVEDDDKPVAIRRYLNEYSRHYRPLPGFRHVYNIDQIKECERTLGLTFLKKQSAAPRVRYRR